MQSTAGARVLLVIGFLAAWIGYDAWIASHVVLNPATTRAAAHALLESSTVRRSLGNQVQQQIVREVPAAARDPRLAPAVSRAMSDPRVVAAFADTVAQIHESVISSAGPGSGVFTVDGGALTAAVHDEIAPTDPLLAAQILHAPPLQLRITQNNLPHVHDARSTTGVIALLASLAAILLVSAALVLRHDRRSIRRVGRRIAFLATTPLLFLVVLPRLLSHASGDLPQISAALLRVYGDRVLPSAIVLVVLGGAVFVGAIVWPKRTVPIGRSGPERPSSYRGPVPTPPPVRPERPEITDRLYL